MDTNRPTVRIALDRHADSLGISYEIENVLETPIYIFDRCYDMEAKDLSPDWADIGFDRDAAILSRKVYSLPPGLIHEEPEVPYARILPPGSRVKEQFKVKLPLVERNPYWGFVHQGGAGKRTEVKITRLAFQVGWAPVSELKGGVPVELNGEKLILFGYTDAILKQKTSSSPSQNGLDLAGITVK